MTNCPNTSDLDQLAIRKLKALDCHFDTPYGQLDTALRLADGLASLIGDHCDWAALPHMGESPCPHQILAAARLIQQQISLARVLADHLQNSREGAA